MAPFANDEIALASGTKVMHIGCRGMATQALGERIRKNDTGYRFKRQLQPVNLSKLFRAGGTRSEMLFKPRFIDVLKPLVVVSGKQQLCPVTFHRSILLL